MGNFQIPGNPGKTEHAQTVCTYQALFSPPTHESLGTRLTEYVLADWSCLSRHKYGIFQCCFN